MFALAFAGLWWLWHPRRERVARALPAVREIQLTAGLRAAALGAQVLVAAFLAPTMFGFWFPPRHLLAGLPLAAPLVAWACGTPEGRPRARGPDGGRSAWLYVDVRWGDGSLAADRPDAPFGPLTDLLPLFTTGGGWPFWLAAAIGVAVAGLVLREARATRHSRQTAGATRARYSG